MTSRRSKGYPITAWSILCALGQDTRSVLDALRAGRSGLTKAPPETPFEAPSGCVTASLPVLVEELRALDTRTHRMAQACLAELAPNVASALERWGPQRVGFVVGSSTGGMAETEAAYGEFVRTGALPSGFHRESQTSFEALVRVVRTLTGARGPGTVVSTACSSGGKAFGTAQRWIDADLVDAVVVGGADSLCQTTLRGFRSLSLVSDEAARPFSSERRGINIGEGAAFTLLERSGQGPRLLGVGESADAHHMSSPDPEGLGAQRAMRAALAAGDVAAEEIDYVNAHGTGTRLNDAMEALAISQVLGRAADRAAIVSTKAYTGHTLGAAGAIEAVFTLEAVRSGWTPASLGADPVDPELAVEIAIESREFSPRAALSNSFAFGGSNVSVLFGAPE